jgi:hypothetical protein
MKHDYFAVRKNSVECCRIALHAFNTVEIDTYFLSSDTSYDLSALLSIRPEVDERSGDPLSARA